MDDQKINNQEPQNSEVKNNPSDDIQKKIEALEKEREEYLNGWKRAKADLINFRKDEEKRFEDLAKWSIKDIVSDLIPVLDNFELAITVLEKDNKTDKGIYMIRSQMEDVLKKRGLEKISTEKGKPFDPNFHEAVGEIDSEYDSGTIAKELEKGYALSGKVIRPARVMISKDKKV